VTVAAPILYFDQTHRWEETQKVSTVLWWVAGALPVLAATVAVRWTWRATDRRPGDVFAAAVLAATFVSAVFLAGTLAFYRWVIPLSGEADWILVSGALAPAVVAAAIGHAIGRAGRYLRPPSPQPTDRGIAPSVTVGAVVTVIGAFLTPMVLQPGAEHSTVAHDWGRYGVVGPDAASLGKPGPFTLGGGRYAIMAMGFAPHDPDCRISGEGLIEHPAKLVTLPPSDYGSDAASYAWIATFTVPGPGTYSLTCESSGGAGNYAVGEIPEIRGAVGTLIQWPLPAIWLLGGIPGLLIILSALRRRARQADYPVSVGRPTPDPPLT
jgi:hypothetical protein